MKDGPFKSSLESTIKEISDFLELHGFPSSPIRIYKGMTIFRWSRDYGWKRDAIEIRYRSTELCVFVSLVVLLKAGDGGDDDQFCEFSGIGLSTPVIPRLFHKVRAKWYAKKVVKLLSKQFSWFEQYGAKEKCLKMSEVETRTGPRGGAAYLSALKKLRE
jgi:hypothetical protein